jgi:hypothetical protein
MSQLFWGKNLGLDYLGQLPAWKQGVGQDCISADTTKAEGGI